MSWINSETPLSQVIGLMLCFGVELAWCNEFVTWSLWL